MTSGAGIIHDVCVVLREYMRLGNKVTDVAGASFVENRKTRRRYDANHVDSIRCSEPAEIDALIACALDNYGDLGHLRFDCDPETPPQFVARVALEGYTSVGVVQLLLDGELRASPKAFEITAVDSDADWVEYDRLQTLNWQESAAKDGRPFDPTLMVEFTNSHRAKTPAVRYFLAWAEGRPRAHFSSWPGVGGIGLVEELFTEQEYRHRGLATALIVHCVADARERGAGPVIIGADVNDTPRHMYAALGFRPLMVTNQYSTVFTPPTS